MSRIVSAPQGSDEWLQARCGVITASNFATAIGTGKTMKTYMYKLAAERITGEVVETYKNDAMARGNELEPIARSEYEFDNNLKVEETGLWLMDDDIGASPDGLVGDDGLIEIKCPLAHTHVGYLDKPGLPSIYKAQVQGQLWVTEREWCDFVSYHPDMKSMKVRVTRDDAYIDELATKIDKFKTELLELVEKVK
jgi:putative phage-type endonuclease